MVVESRNEELFLKKMFRTKQKWISTKASHLNVYFYKYISEVKKENFFQNLQKTVLLKKQRRILKENLKPKYKVECF